MHSSGRSTADGNIRIRSLIILAGFSSFVACHVPASGQQADPEDNAAVFYRQAAVSWQAPSESAREEISSICKSGWNFSSPEAEAYLARNTACLQEMFSAAALRDCDFTFGKGGEFSEDAEFNLFKLIETVKLLFLNARYHTARNDPDKAIDSCLACLAFARHLTQTKGVLYKNVSLRLGGDACNVLRTSLRFPGFTAEKKARALAYIIEYKESHYGLTDILRESRDDFMRAVVEVAEGGEFAFSTKVFSSLGDLPKSTPQRGLYEEYNHDGEFKKEVLRQGELLCRQYYDVLIAAIESAGEDTSDKTIRGLKVLESRLSPRQENGWGFLLKTWGSRLMGKRKAREYLAAVLVRQVLFPGIQGNQIPKAFDRYQSWEKEISKLQKALAS